MSLIQTVLKNSHKFLFRKNIILTTRTQLVLKSTKMSATASDYSIVERGQLNTLSYRVYVKNTKTNTLISPFHDIELYANKEKQLFNVVIEIPRWSNAKMEINKKEKLNPILQDIKSNKLRFVNNCFPYHGYPWNYGALPQTFEDPEHTDELTGCKGDNDPLDVVEIGSRIHERGSIITVKVVGALGLIDEGEADWKIIAIDVNDPLASQLNDIDDVEKHLPGLLDATRDWFRIYKIPTNKPANKFALDGQYLNREFALKQIALTNELWSNLFKKETKGVNLTNTTLDETLGLKICNDEAQRIINTDSQPFNPQPFDIDRLPIDTVHYIDRSKI